MCEGKFGGSDGVYDGYGLMNEMVKLWINM